MIETYNSKYPFRCFLIFVCIFIYSYVCIESPEIKDVLWDDLGVSHSAKDGIYKATTFSEPKEAPVVI